MTSTVRGHTFLVWMSLIVGNDDSQSRSDYIRDPSINPNMSEIWNTATSGEFGGVEFDDDDESQKLADSDPEKFQQQNLKRSLSPDTSFNPTSANKSRRTSVHHSAAMLAKEGMQNLGECMKAAMASITRFDQCLPLLSQMREEGILSKGDYLQYSRLLRNDEKLAAMFVGMDNDLRVEWLELELELSLTN